VTTLVQSTVQSRSRREAAIAAAGGSGTVARSVRVTRTGQDESVSTLVGGLARPPLWIEQVIQEELPTRDEFGLIHLETLVRFALACSFLPTLTPKPFVDVGDDATLGAEWDIGPFHVEIQVGNNPAVDSLVFEVEGGEVSELPLEGNISTFVMVMSEITSYR
jgi:hypothetical protein